VNLRHPPRDPAALSAFPARSIAEASPYARIHDAAGQAEWFCSCGDHRVVTRERVDAHRLAELQVPATRLADVTSRAALHWGVTAEVSAGGDYTGAQEWAERLFQAGFGGIWYPATHDPQGDLHSVALFGPPGVHEEAFVSTSSRRISRELIDEVEAQFGIQVLPTAPV
jgi:hypothetical protein